MTSFDSSKLKTDRLVKKSKKLSQLLDNAVGYSNASLNTLSMAEFLKSYLIQENIDRDAYYSILSKYRDNWIVNAIYDVIMNDIFIDSGYNDYIKITIEKRDDKFQKEAESLFRRLNIGEVLQSITPDLLHYGAYPLKILAKEGKGVIALIDDVEPQHVIAISDSASRPLCFFVDESVHNVRATASGFVSQYQSSEKKYNYYDITELLYFSLDLDFIKLKLPDFASKNIKEQVHNNRSGLKNVLKVYYEIDLSHPDRTIVTKEQRVLKQIDDTPEKYEIEDSSENEVEDEFESLIPGCVKIRSSKSLIWGILDKLKDSILLNKMAVYGNMAELFAPKLVGIPVPDAYDPKQLVEITQKYEQLLNSDLSKLSYTNDFNNINFSEIAKIKVIPIAGDRSTPTSIDYGADNKTIDPDKISDNLKEALNALGVPPELFYGGSSPKENLKTNVRYAKKIKKIQHNIARTLKYLLLIHFGYKWPNEVVSFDDIDIQLKNNVNIDELENMESQDLVISASNSVLSMYSSLAELNNASKDAGKHPEYEIDQSEILKAVKDQLTMIGSPFAAGIKKSSTISNNDILVDPASSDRINDTSLSVRGRGVRYDNQDSSDSEDSGEDFITNDVDIESDTASEETSK